MCTTPPPPPLPPDSAPPPPPPLRRLTTLAARVDPPPLWIPMVPLPLSLALSLSSLRCMRACFCGICLFCTAGLFDNRSASILIQTAENNPIVDRAKLQLSLFYRSCELCKCHTWYIYIYIYIYIFIISHLAVKWIETCARNWKDL